MCFLKRNVIHALLFGHNSDAVFQRTLTTERLMIDSFYNSLCLKNRYSAYIFITGFKWRNKLVNVNVEGGEKKKYLAGCIQLSQHPAAFILTLSRLVNIKSAHLLACAKQHKLIISPKG